MDTATDDFLTAVEVKAKLAEAKRLHVEAAEHRKVAAKDLETARIERGQTEFNNREISQKLFALQKREELLKQYDAREAALAEREAALKVRQKAVDEKLSHYDADRHRTMQTLARDLEKSK